MFYAYNCYYMYIYGYIIILNINVSLSIGKSSLVSSSVCIYRLLYWLFFIISQTSLHHSVHLAHLAWWSMTGQTLGRRWSHNMAIPTFILDACMGVALIIKSVRFPQRVAFPHTQSLKWPGRCCWDLLADTFQSNAQMGCFSFIYFFFCCCCYHH